MKYLVMECHDAYAVLMGEDASCVRAANLHYTVGQTVTDPILMQEDTPQKQIRMSRKIAMRCAAAAACLLLAGGAGFGYYLRNMKTRSTIMMSSDLKIMIELNSRGNVVCIKSDEPDVQEMLAQYDGRKKSKLDVIRDLIEMEKEQGILSEGDTVDLYLTLDDSNNYSAYKSELEQDTGAQDVTINVQPIEQYQDGAEQVSAPQPPEPPAKEDPPAPKEPPHPDGDQHPAPPDPKDGPGKHDPKEPPEPKEPPHPHEDTEAPHPPAAEPPAPQPPAGQDAEKPVPEPHEHPQADDPAHDPAHQTPDEPEKPAPPEPRPEPLAEPEALPEPAAPPAALP